jgi:hypothetical protein
MASESDFIVLLPHEMIQIPQDSNFAWLTMFYALPRELVEKRSEYLDLPRNIVKLMKSEKHMNLIQEDAFLELVWDCYAWGIWQAIKVPDDKGGYKEIPGDWQNYSGDFPIWRLTYSGKRRQTEYRRPYRAHSLKPSSPVRMPVQ